MVKTDTQYFESCSVQGDKITIHKCVIDKAIKDIKADPDPYGNADEKAGRIRLLEDMLQAIRKASVIEDERRWKRQDKEERYNRK